MSATEVLADSNVGTAQELKTVIEGLTDDNQTINLTAKVTLTENINAPHSFTLNLGSYSITKGNYSIRLADGVTVTTSKNGTYYSTTHEGWQVCAKKTEYGYAFTPALAVANNSSYYYATIEDAVYGLYIPSTSNPTTITMLADATMTRDVDCNLIAQATINIKQGEFTLTPNGHKIFIRRDVTGKSKVENLFAIREGETNCKLIQVSPTTDYPYGYQVVYNKEAKVGDTEYDTFAEAIAAANAANGATITPLRNGLKYTMTSPDEVLNIKRVGCIYIYDNNNHNNHSYSVTINAPAGYVIDKTGYKDGTDLDGKDLWTDNYKATTASIEFTAPNAAPTYSASFPNSLQSGTYKLLQDKTVTTRIPTAQFADNVTVDLNGHTLTNTKATDSEQYCFGLPYTNQKLTIKDSSEGKTGKVVANNCIFVNSSGNELNIEAAIEVTGDFAVATNGSTTTSGTINIKEGAKLTSTVTALYLPGVVNATISGGTITGATAIYQKSGTLNITGGTFIGNGAKADFVHNGNGANATGDAIVIENCGYPGGAPQIAISGGTFTSTNGKAVASYAYGNYKPITGFISSGTFSSEINEYVAEGKKAIQETANVYKVYGVETSTGTDTAEEHQETVTVKDGDDTKQTITVSVKPTSEQTETAGDLALNQVNMSSVIDAVMEGAVLGTEENVTVAIELQVNAEVKDSDVEDDTKTITFEVKPEAVVKINNQETAVELSNDNLAPNATFTFTLNVTAMELSAGDQVKVVHTSNDPNYQNETFMATVWAEDGKQYVTITTTHFSVFEIKNEAISDNDDITLIDGVTEYNITSDVTVKSATYERTFPETQVNKFMGWFVPFDYTVTEDDAARAMFYKIDMIAHSATQGTTDQIDESKIWIHLKEVTAGTTLKGNKPYLIKPLISGKFTFEGKNELLAMTNESILSASTTSNEYNFYGTYSVFTKAEESDADFMYMKGGQIHWCTITGITVPAFRWIIKVNGKADYARIAFTEDGEETTAIQNAEVAEPSAIEGYYTLNGVKVEKPGKGVYVVKYANGQVSKIRIR